MLTPDLGVGVVAGGAAGLRFFGLGSGRVHGAGWAETGKGWVKRQGVEGGYG